MKLSVMAALLAGLLSLTTPVRAQDTAALKYVTQHIWACEGRSYNRVIPGGYMDWELALLVAVDEDNLIKQGSVKMFYTIGKGDGNYQTYSAIYTSGGFIYDTVEDGTGVYLERLVRKSGDDIAQFELAWPNYMTVIVRTTPGEQAVPPFRMEGQLQHSGDGDIDEIKCVARDDY